MVGLSLPYPFTYVPFMLQSVLVLKKRAQSTKGRFSSKNTVILNVPTPSNPAAVGGVRVIKTIVSIFFTNLLKSASVLSWLYIITPTQTYTYIHRLFDALFTGHVLISLFVFVLF